MRYELNTFAHYQFDVRIHSIGGKGWEIFRVWFPKTVKNEEARAGRMEAGVRCW